SIPCWASKTHGISMPVTERISISPGTCGDSWNFSRSSPRTAQKIQRRNAMNQFNDSCPPDSRLAVELADMLNAREQRVCTQMELLTARNCPLISLTMNIPGPVKLLPHVTDAFQDGLKEVEGALARLGLNVVHREMIREKTGWEAFLSVDGTPEAV